MNGIFQKNSRESKETLENKVAREKGAKTWYENLLEIGKSALGMEKTASAKPVEVDVVHADKEVSAVHGNHYFGGSRRLADTKDRKMEYIIASGKEMIGEKLGDLKLTGAKALFLKADIQDWDDETNQPLNGTLSFDIAFQAPTGDPRTVSASIVIEGGQPQEPSYFSDGVGKKYAFDAKGIDELLEGTDFEVMNNPKVERENSFFENPGHLASTRGDMAVKRAGREGGLVKKAGSTAVSYAREGLIRKISEEEKGKDATMKGAYGAGRFQFRKRTPSDVGGNAPYAKENNIPCEQFGANENDPDALASRRRAGLKRKAVDEMAPAPGQAPVSEQAPEGMESDILNIEQHLNINEFRDFQNLQKVSDDMWTVIRQREQLNEKKGLPSYTNVDYSDIKLVDKQIQDYVDQAKQRAQKEEKPAEEDVMIEEPKNEEAPEAKKEEKEVPEETLTPEKGKGKPDMESIPEFASARTRMQRKGKGGDFVVPEMPTEQELDEYYKSKEEKQRNDLALKERKKEEKNADVEVRDLAKEATTSWDYPRACENCKLLIVPSGYSELTEIDMHRKPFCGAIGKGEGIGFEFAHFRECKGYDPISKEITQEIQKNVYDKPYQLHRRSGQTERLMTKKANMDKLIAERKAQATVAMRKLAEEATGTAHPECGKCSDCIPAGEGHVAHDYCKVWQTACSNIVIMPSGACVPASVAGQSSETLQKATSQFIRGQEV